MFRIPLLEPNTLVVSQLDLDATASNDPDGAGPLTPGSDIWQAPTVYEAGGAAGTAKEDTRVYLTQVRFPVQVEVLDDAQMREVLGGNAPISRYVFIAHLQHLVPLGLEDVLKPRDRIDAVEVYHHPGVIALPLREPLYIYEVEYGSPGTGPTGFDLRILYTTSNPDTVAGS